MALDKAPNALRRNQPIAAANGAITREAHTSLEEVWRQVVAGFVVVPCVAGTVANFINLTPRLHEEGGDTYGDGMLWSFTADATSSGAVTANVGTLPTRKVYANSGAIQAGSSDIVSGSTYILMYEGALDGAAGGFVLFAGQQTPAAVAVAVLPFIYPVGCIYFSTDSTNPATSLGFGTWVAFGAGKVPVGFLNADPDFGTDEATGGAKTHTLTQPEMPVHGHSVATYGADTGSGAIALLRSVVAAGDASVTADTIQTDGSGNAHNNLQPFVVVRMWKRTA